MGNLGVELDAVKATLGIPDGCSRGIGGMGQDGKAGRQLGYSVAMAHPHRRLRLEAGEEGLELVDPKDGRPVFPPGPSLHLASQESSQQLMPVADAQEGNPGLQEFRVATRGLGLVDAMGPPRKDDALRTVSQDSLQGGVAGEDLAIDLALPHLAGDQLAILGAEVQHQDTLFGMRAHRG